MNTESGPLYFEVSGDGPPLVFVSGWAMSCECWRLAVRSLRHKYRCLIYDSRGVARSQPCSIDARFAVEDHAEDLHRLVEDAGMFDAVMIGHEVGSLVVAACADAHPQDLRSKVIVSPRARVSKDDVKSLAVFTPASLALRELAAYPVIRNLVARRFRRAPKPFRDRLFSDFADLSPRAAYETALSATAPESALLLDRETGQAVSPILFICGDKDKKGTTEARRLFSLAREGRLATLRGCGFLPMLEYPNQFVKLIDDFVAGSLHRPRRALYSIE
ncbi:MAG TPA: alpha/beta hydrolase [Blastocatellia bacterium]|nr:alpha/beta hydrolase [Blastocatellia bacterium]